MFLVLNIVTKKQQEEMDLGINMHPIGPNIEAIATTNWTRNGLEGKIVFTAVIVGFATVYILIQY